MKNIITKFKSLSLTYRVASVVLLTILISVALIPPVPENVDSLQSRAETVVSDKVLDNVPNPQTLSSEAMYEVVKVVDGDTVDVFIDGKVERLRLIGINTPETVDPRKVVECFGLEASNKAKAQLTGKKVLLEGDSSQDERDKYNRLLRYVFLEDGTNFNLMMIQEGYAYEYTYAVPYKYQSQFKEAQINASKEKKGLWGDLCNSLIPEVIGNKAPASHSENLVSPAVVLVEAGGENACKIKGNISSGGEKIYHMTGCGSYTKTKVDESQGEKWFCSESEAVNAGWRKALNCN